MSRFSIERPRRLLGDGGPERAELSEIEKETAKLKNAIEKERNKPEHRFKLPKNVLRDLEQSPVYLGETSDFKKFSAAYEEISQTHPLSINKNYNDAHNHLFLRTRYLTLQQMIKNTDVPEDIRALFMRLNVDTVQQTPPPDRRIPYILYLVIYSLKRRKFERAKQDMQEIIHIQEQIEQEAARKHARITAAHGLSIAGVGAEEGALSRAEEDTRGGMEVVEEEEKNPRDE